MLAQCHPDNPPGGDSTNARSREPGSLSFNSPVDQSPAVGLPLPGTGARQCPAAPPERAPDPGREAGAASSDWASGQSRPALRARRGPAYALHLGLLRAENGCPSWWALNGRTNCQVLFVTALVNDALSPQERGQRGQAGHERRDTRRSPPAREWPGPCRNPGSYLATETAPCGSPAYARLTSARGFSWQKARRRLAPAQFRY